MAFPTTTDGRCIWIQLARAAEKRRYGAGPPLPRDEGRELILPERFTKNESDLRGCVFADSSLNNIDELMMSPLGEKA
eukprot:6458581-Pyramimonas_sp.AAC.1